MKILTFNSTQTQRRILEMAGQIGNLCAVFRLQGTIDVPRLEKAIAATISQATPLAYRFLRNQDSLQILVSSESFVALNVHDSRLESEDWRYSLIQDLCRRQFRVDGGTPFQFTLLLTETGGDLIFACHPVILDQFSLHPLLTEISRAYNQPAYSVPELDLAQDDLVKEEQAILASPRFRESMRFWLRLLRDSAFEWRPPRLETTTAQLSDVLTLDPDATARLQKLAAAFGATFSDLLQCAFHMFLARTTRNEFVLTSFHQRMPTQARGVVGFHENKIALKSQIDLSLSFRQIFLQTLNLMRQMHHHGNVPAREISRELRRSEPDFQRATNTLFEPDPLPYLALQLDGLDCHLLPHYSRRQEQEDFAIYYHAQEGELTLAFQSRTAQDLSGLRGSLLHFLTLLDSLPANIEVPASQIPLLSPPQMQQIRRWSRGDELDHQPLDFCTLFDQVTHEIPTLPALTFNGRTWSYRDLQTVTRRIAGNLQAELPLAKNHETLIAICLPRGEGYVQAILGILAMGGAYIPLDPSQPQSRLQYILNDSKAQALITDNSTQSLFSSFSSDAKILSLEHLRQTENPERTWTPVTVPAERAAYVIYTSGTTGEPKGVTVERQNLAILLASLSTRWHRNRYAKWLQFSAFTFDASVIEIFFPLSGGAHLVITPSELRTNPEDVYNLMLQEKITNADLPPALLTLLPRQILPDLKMIMCGGEALDEDASRFWAKTTELNNCYGPTEATVMATINILGGSKSASNLGRPIPGYEVYILDDHHVGEPTLAGLGAVGEIAIGGHAVARGYLGRTNLTQQKFVPNPFSSGKLYRTGDLGRWLPNGEIEFLGRKDFQVKIRGFRIEIGEIESAIASQPEVRGVHVQAQTINEQKCLVAWYVSADLSPERLRKRLSTRLPHYMVPSYLLKVDSFPLTLNGKVDLRRLPAPMAQDATLNDLELDSTQEAIREIWAHTLKVRKSSIGLDSNFFHMGGHSLTAALVCNEWNKLHSTDLRSKTLFESPVFNDFCEKLRTLPAVLTPRKPLLPTQARLAPVNSRLIGLIFARAISNPDDNMYNVVTQIEFSGQMNPERLRQATQDLLQENPIFSAEFFEQHGQLFVRAGSGLPQAQVPIVDKTRNEIESWCKGLAQLALGVQSAPLWRAEIAKLENGDLTLIFCIHHALFDGWSLNLMMEELLLRYQQKPLPARPLNWFDYNIWAQDLAKSNRFQDSLVYWRKKLQGVEGRVDLPVINKTKSANSSACFNIRLDAKLVQRLQGLATTHSVTLPPVLFSAYLVWLWRISNQASLVCAYPYAGRDEVGTESIFGTFVTMGFLAQTIQPEQSFVDLVKSLHRQMIEDKDHLVAAPYDAEIANVDAVNVIFSLQTGISLNGKIQDVSYSAMELPSETPKGDLAGIFYETGDGAIEGRIEYDSTRLSADQMTGFVDCFRQILESASNSAPSRVQELTYLPPATLNQILTAATGPTLKIPDQNIVTRFQNIATQFPNQIAIQFREKKITYQELDRWSDDLATVLLTQIQPGQKIGMSFQKSPEAIVTILAILKTGGSYVPLDSSYPEARIAHFITNADISLIVADSTSRELLQKMDLRLPVKFFEVGEDHKSLPSVSQESSQISIPPESLAYIIHTSGSTGLPKGVMIEHRTVVRLAASCLEPMSYRPGARSSLIASLSFDTSVLEIFLALLNGGTLVVVPEDIRKDPVKLHQLLRSELVTHAILAPVMLQSLPREPLPSLEMLGYGGDALSESAANWWRENAPLYSLYGPTEITVQSSVGRILPGGHFRSIGKPMPGYRHYLLSPTHQPVPWGAIGEIAIGGQGMSRGYLNQPEMTLEKFVIDPLDESPYATVYLTGDRGRFSSDGSIEFVGRNDNQLKIRGFRVELGEIEIQMAACPGVLEAACAAKGQGENRILVAYYKAAAEIPPETLRSFLSKTLPDYMRPAFFVHLKKWPLTPNGKLDRNALPDVATRVVDRPPTSTLEMEIAEIWEQVLQFRGLNRDDNFFHIGGNSLLAVRLQSELRAQLNLQFSIADFYEDPTIRALAEGFRSESLKIAAADVEAARLSPWKVEPRDKSPVPPERRPGQKILLTGAMGFLGLHLLRQFLQQGQEVICLLRVATVEEGQKKLQAATRQAEMLDLVDKIPALVTVVCGDLAKPKLGLSASQWQVLIDQTESVCHCAAQVHHLQSYQTLRPVNILGTLELLSLAQLAQVKAFCFVSTLSAAFVANPTALSAPEAIVDGAPRIENGYMLSKWVGEQIVSSWQKATQIPTLIVRPGNITGDESSGVTNFSQNHFWHLIKACLQLGHRPHNPSPIEMIPVNRLAEATVALLRIKSETLKGLTVANLVNPHTQSTFEFYQLLGELGYPTTEVSWPAWQAEIFAAPDSNALRKWRDLYVGDVGEHAPQIEQSEVRKILQELKIELGANPEKLLPIYIRYLQSEGFLPPASRGLKSIAR